MRVHIDMDEELVRRIDSVAGKRGRSQFVRDAVETAIDRERRARLIESALGSIPDQGHDWDDDPAKWIHDQRRADPRRVG